MAGDVIDVPNPFGGSTPIVYDGERRIINFNNGTGTYNYDADCNRIRKSAGGGLIGVHPVGGGPLAQIDNNGNWTDNIYANGQQIAASLITDTDVGMQATFSGTG